MLRLACASVDPTRLCLKCDLSSLCCLLIFQRYWSVGVFNDSCSLPRRRLSAPGAKRQIAHGNAMWNVT